MFTFLHGYLPKVWEEQEKAGLISENDGVRFCQNISLSPEMKFNQLAKKNGELYNILAERKCPFYIDRLQGGTFIEEYPYDKALLQEYKTMLKENFWGFQMHEWMSNYRYDSLGKLIDLKDEDWTKEGIEAHILKKFPYPWLNLESMTAQEMADYGRPKNREEFYNSITAIYKNRMRLGDLIPCDSYSLAYNFEVSCGTKRLMPEVGAQTPNARLQICYARGMTRKAGRSFGVYYEPWGGSPFSACCYHRENKNEWGIVDSKEFPFETKGENGGSSRSLQKRVFLYGYLSGAEFMSEEWGLCNVFYDWHDFELSPYGTTKKEFINFTRKYKDIGEKIVPIAAVLPADMMVLDDLHSDEMYCAFEIKSDKIAKAKQGIREIFTTSLPMIGTETTTLKNSDVPDAIDLVNENETVFDKYEYFVDLTGNDNFAKQHKNVCSINEVKKILQKILPCYVEGNAHWMLNVCTSGGYYLSVFNHSGIERTVEKGEIRLPEAETTVTLQFKQDILPKVCEGDGRWSRVDGVYRLTIPAGGWSFIKFEF